MPKIQLSVIIAVYNRSDELTELLQSLSQQTNTDFDTIVVDDGSKEDLKPVIDNFKSKLSLNYYYKPNSGAGLSRNFGAKNASGNYFIFIDSDCIVPEDYISNIKNELSKSYCDAFGGADAAHESFNDWQKAISYAMTSVFTTGGIRGKAKSVTKFQPRSFNMGISRQAFETVNGFSEMRIGEDPDLSLSLWEKGFTTRFFAEIQVFHKRRTSLKKFAKQVYQFGIARPILNQRHPKFTKLVFWFPSLFLIGSLFALLFYIIQIDLVFSFIVQKFKLDFISSEKIAIVEIYQKILAIPFLIVVLYFLVIFMHSSITHKNIKIGFLSVITSAVQLYNYGFGFLQSFLKLNVLKQKPETAFPSHFYQKK